MNIGKISESVLKHSILHQIHTKNDEVLEGAGIGEDCALFAFSKEEAVAVSVREAAVATKAALDFADTEKVSMAHLIQKCANNLAARGAKPIAAMIVLLLPQTAEPEDVKKLMEEAEETCAGLSMQIAGGQTRVSKAVTAPLAMVSGYGTVSGQNYAALKAVKPGQAIVLSKWAGLEGTAILARKYKDRLGARYPAYLAEEAKGFDKYLSVIPEAATAMKSGVCAMHDASEGGIFASLWELAEGAGIGLDIDLRKIPLRQETVEICECCGVNPYELLSGGCLIMVTENGERLIEALEAEGIPAAMVGRTTDSNDRILHNGEEVRYMNRPQTDALYKEPVESGT
ncbi:MAG: AIR synthase-related protein [Bacteroidales bacterium]|nr:AIR synthase-related protein [Lachnoclostridium sp.]MCM1385378.1 AIR synthase-related protein [Lachnoclostridium sp.]MCM1466184.1 AIR synthase-related protein [Bacteroidales bacterium]